MSTVFRAKVIKEYREEAAAFRTRADINDAYVHLKVEFDKLAEIIDRDDLPAEMFINADLSKLVVELSSTIQKLGKRNANLQKEAKKVDGLRSELLWWRGTSCHEHPNP